LEFGGQWPLTMRARCSAFRHCPDLLGIVTAKQFDKLEFGGLWPLTMRYELHQSNSILWALDQLLVSALRTEFT